MAALRICKHSKKVKSNRLKVTGEKLCNIFIAYLDSRQLDL